MLRYRNLTCAVLIALTAGCAGDSGSPLAPEAGPTVDVSDAAHAGAVPGFYFLPPMVPQPTYSGTFDAALSPRVEICELSGGSCGTVIANFTMTSGSGGQVVRVEPTSQQYAVNWDTDAYNLDPAKTYRISVYVGTFRLGFADLDVVSSGNQLKNVDTQEYIPLVDGRTLPIKFRIETGIVASVVVSPATATIDVGETQQFTAALTDLHGDPIAAPVTWSTSAAGTATIDGNGLATGVAPGTTTITATSGGASGAASLTVVNPNTAPAAVDDAFDAIGNVTVPVAAPGLLGNDTDAENNTLAVVAGTFATANGGTVTLNADGSFSYLSAAGFTNNSDSFTYVVTDGNLTATGTATIQVGFRVWYVKNDATAPGDGRDASPFTTLKAAETASSAGETIFLFAGDGTTTGYDQGIVLKSGQVLTGQGVAASISTTLNGQPVVLLAAGSAPQITRSTAGATIQLATGNLVQGVSVASTAGAGIAGSSFGTFTAGSVSVSAVGGPALDLQSGAVAAAFSALSSTGSSGAGLRLHDLSGTLTGAGGSISGAAGAGVDVSGGTADIAYAGDVTNAAARVVSVTGRSGGTLTLSGDLLDTGTGILVQNNTGGTIAFTGSSKVLNTGASPAVSLLSNSGATIQFAGGGLSITTSTATGFDASGGGTVQVTGANNAIGSTGGIALSVLNTTIGAGGLTFRAISASNGTHGIRLENTGSSNGLQVTGTGTAGSGGTIQNTGVGASFSGARNIELSWMSFTNANTLDGGLAGACDGVTFSACQGAIRLSGVTGVTLDRITISGAAENGIFGSSVTHLTVSNSTIQNTGSGASEHGIRIEGLFGTTAAGTASAITGTTVSAAGSHNVLIRNSTATNAYPGAADRLVISGSTFTNPGTTSPLTPSDGVNVVASGTANLQTVVQNGTFTHSPGTGRQAVEGIQASAQGSARLDVSVTGSSFTGFNTAVNVSGANTSNSAFNISSNPTISVNAGTAINIASSGDANLRGTIAANPSISTSAAGNGGSGIAIVVDQTGSAVVDVDGNTVAGSGSAGFQQGIWGGARNAGTGEADLTIRNNTIASGGSFDFAGAYFFSGNGSAGESNRVCLALSNNNIATSSPFGFDYLLEQYTGNAFQLQGFAGSATNPADVASFISGTDVGGAVVEPAGGSTVNFTSATCATP